MRYIIRVVLPVIFLAFFSSICTIGMAADAQEETMLGAVVKRGKVFVIEADEGDYIVKGKDVSKFVDKLVIVTGIIKESPKGDVIEIKTVEDIQESLQDY
jgi:hypothetical protein